jgi:G:T/U-mismatch repair DNA glycosylase
LLREGLTPDEQLSMLRSALEMAESGQRYLHSVNDMWKLIERLGGDAELADELTRARLQFESIGREATRAISMRKTGWQPADAARLERGRQEMQDGKALSPDEARARFQKQPG